MEASERIYTIPLREVYEKRRRARARRASREVMKFITKHMKATKVKLSSDVNDALWSHGATAPPRRIRVIAKKSAEGIVSVSLAEKKMENKEQKAADAGNVKTVAKQAQSGGEARETKAVTKG